MVSEPESDFADPKQLLQHLDRLQRAHDAGERAQHAVARAALVEVALRRFPKHAAIAR